jgi:hypothetical protein
MRNTPVPSEIRGEQMLAVCESCLQTVVVSCHTLSDTTFWVCDPCSPRG